MERYLRLFSGGARGTQIPASNARLPVALMPTPPPSVARTPKPHVPQPRQSLRGPLPEPDGELVLVKSCSLAIRTAAY